MRPLIRLGSTHNNGSLCLPAFQVHLKNLVRDVLTMCASFFSNILHRLGKLRSVSCFRYRMLPKISVVCSETLSLFPLASHYLEIWLRNWSNIVTMCAKLFSNISEIFEKVRPVPCSRNIMLPKISLAHRITDSNHHFQTSGLAKFTSFHKSGFLLTRFYGLISILAESILERHYLLLRSVRIL